MSDADPEDNDRLRLRPELRLRAWEQCAVPMAALIDAPLGVLGRELSRSALIFPNQDTNGLAPLVERLVNTWPVTPEDRAMVTDAANALECIGVVVPSARVRLGAWNFALTAVEPPFPGRLNGGFAALAIDDTIRAAWVAPIPYDVTSGEVFPANVHALLGYAVWTVRNKGSLDTLRPALDRVAEDLDVLYTSQQIDESTLLWIARFAFHALDGAPLGTVAARARDWLYEAPARLEQDRARPPEPPIGATAGGGAFVIEHQLRGGGYDRLYRARDSASRAPLLVAYGFFRRKHNVAELRVAVDYDAPGLLPLAHVGHLDGDTQVWTIIERASGTWLPTLVGAADPWTAPRKAVELGISAGRILLGALHLGSRLINVRPEVMWGEIRDGHYAVTGLSPRPFELFARSYGDAVMRPLFMHHYRDPRAAEPGYTFDDRSLTFSLATMVAEWTIGTYPLLQTWANETTDHMSLYEVPRALRAVLEPALSSALAGRPDLATFVAELERVAPGLVRR
jgi:hypothetical protein